LRRRQTQRRARFLSDSRTNAGLDQISSFRKMMVYEKTGDRFMVLLSAGNLSISQSVREILQTQHIRDEQTGEILTIWNVTSMFDAARVLGAAVRHVHDRDGVALKRAGGLQCLHGVWRPDPGRRHAPVPGVFGRQLHRSHL
jgi:predicted proteasome-type protease